MPSEDFYSPDASSKISEGLRRVRSWVRTADYGTVKKADLPINPYSDYRYKTRQGFSEGCWSINKSTGQISIVDPPQYRHSVSTLASHIGNDATEFHATHFAGMGAVIQNRLLVQALASISDAKTNLAVSLAEASKTSRLILDTARRVSGAYRAFRRGDVKGIAENLHITQRKLHSNWLAYKYGWMPLLFDVKNSAEFFAQQSLGGRVPSFVVSKTETLSHSTTTIVGYHNPIGTISVPVTRVRTNVSKLRLKLWLEINNPQFNQLQQLGLTNPALVAWELIPFSFVFDWFISVGTYLQGLTALHGVTVRKAMFSTATLYTTDSSWPPSSKDEGSTISVDTGGSYGGSVPAYERSSITVDPSTTFPPRNQASFGFEKLVTSLALLKAVSRK